MLIVPEPFRIVPGMVLVHWKDVNVIPDTRESIAVGYWNGIAQTIAVVMVNVVQQTLLVFVMLVTPVRIVPWANAPATVQGMALV